MKTTWHETTLGQFVDFQSGGTPSKGNPDFWNGSIPWVSAKDMKQLFLDDTEDHITTAAADDGAKQVPGGTVLMLTRGMTLLNDVPICIVRRSMSFNQDVKALRPKGDLDSRFLPYLLLGNKHRLLNMVDLAGHGTGRLNTEELKTLDVSLPSTTEQQAIACILGALDDKIELNRRRNRTLEAMARAIFQSWFVDFDPVQAKAAGRKPAGLSPALAALFPDRFDDSPLGPIPAGWKTGTLAEVAGFVLGGDWGKDSKTDETPAPAYCIRGADIPSLQSGGLGEMPIRHLKESSLVKRSLRHGDLVIEISGGSPTQSTGRPVLISSGLLSSLEHPLTCSNFCRLFRPKSHHYSEYLYLLMRWHYDFETFLQYENGTTGIKNFAFSKFAESHRVQLGSPVVVEAFAKATQPLMVQRQELGKESRTLAALRDSLLPKLISGELRVPDAERIIGRAV